MLEPMSHFEELSQRLSVSGLSEAERHLRQAHAAFTREEWESCNAQMRSALESLFNHVAEITTGTTKTGGKAREHLETRGVLPARSARLVQEFMAVAGGAGSHAGASHRDECLGRYLAGIGIAFLGLSLLPELTKVEAVLRGQLQPPAGCRLPLDSEIQTSCPACGTEQDLAQAPASRRGAETIYTCCHGCQVIVVVSPPGDSLWPGRGYRLGAHVIRNARDLVLPIVGSPKSLLIPASPAALMVKAAPNR